MFSAYLPWYSEPSHCIAPYGPTEPAIRISTIQLQLNYDKVLIFSSINIY